MAANAAIKPRRHDLFCSSVTDFILRCQLCFVLLSIVRPVALLAVYFPLRCSLVFDMSALLLCATAQRCRLCEDWVGRAYTFPYHGPTPLQSGPTAVDLPTLTGARPQASPDCVYLLAPRMLAQWGAWQTSEVPRGSWAGQEDLRGPCVPG